MPRAPSAEARADREFHGRLVESAVGAHLANAAAGGLCELFYWRERNREVDFVLRAGRALVALIRRWHGDCSVLCKKESRRHGRRPIGLEPSGSANG